MHFVFRLATYKKEMIAGIEKMNSKRMGKYKMLGSQQLCMHSVDEYI